MRFTTNSLAYCYKTKDLVVSCAFPRNNRPLFILFIAYSFMTSFIVIRTKLCCDKILPRSFFTLEAFTQIH
jgi:hypothetical protein